MLSYTPHDIYEMAENLEYNGVQFYTRAAELAAQENLRNLFTALADMEEAHRRRFQEFRIAYAPDSVATGLPDTAAENSLYLQAIADTHVFTLAGDALEGFLQQATSTATLDFAIECEKESILFYLTLQELLSPSEGRTVLDAVIHDELQHVRQLRREKAVQDHHMTPQEESTHDI